MSKKSSQWQNGRQESFYQKLKFELEDFNAYQSQGELIEAIALQIYYYNNKRIHLALKMPPALFYQRFSQENFSKKIGAFTSLLCIREMQRRAIF